jgi:hypothetical protein
VLKLNVVLGKVIRKAAFIGFRALFEVEWIRRADAPFSNCV